MKKTGPSQWELWLRWIWDILKYLSSGGKSIFRRKKPEQLIPENILKLLQLKI